MSQSALRDTPPAASPPPKRPLRASSLRLRSLTQKGFRVRGAARLCEAVRRRYVASAECGTITDFDGDLSVEVNLSEHIGSHIFWRGYYSGEQLSVMAKYLKPDSVFFDAGANIGEFTLFAAKRVPNGVVHSFEPTSSLYARLGANVALNRFANVRAHRLALSDEEGEMDIHIPVMTFEDGTEHAGLGSLYDTKGGETTERIQVTTLDKFVEKERITRLDVMKMDIEGAELPALRGAKETLTRFKPVLILEVNEETCLRAGYEQREILSFLRDLGYAFQRIGDRAVLSPCDESGLSDFQNVLALPTHPPDPLSRRAAGAGEVGR